MKKALAGLFLILSIFPASAQKSKSALQTEINSAWPDNTTGQITPKALRTPNQDIVNSYLDLNGAASFACPGGQVISGFSDLSTPVCVSAGGGLPSLTATHIFVGNNLNVPTDVGMSGDCAMVVSGAITCTKTNGAAFVSSATTDTTNAANISSGTLPSSRLPSITNSLLATMTALSIKANGTNAIATPTDISTTSGSNFPLRENGAGALSFGPLNGGFALNNGSTPLNKLANGTQDTIAGYFGSTTFSALAINNCTNALTYSTSTHTFGCNSSAGTGTVTTTGSPASGNLVAFSGTASVTNSNLSGDCTTSGTLAVSCTNLNATNLTSGTVPLARVTGVLATTNLTDTTTDTAWTPTDNSGAGLTFTNVTARYTKIGKMVTAQFRLTFPSTVNAAAVNFAGLPVAMSSNFTAASPISSGTCFSSLGTNSMFTVRLQAGATTFDIINNAATVPNNATMSTIVLTCMLNYVST